MGRVKTWVDLRSIYLRSSRKRVNRRLFDIPRPLSPRRVLLASAVSARRFPCSGAPRQRDLTVSRCGCGAVHPRILGCRLEISRARCAVSLVSHTVSHTVPLRISCYDSRNHAIPATRVFRVLVRPPMPRAISHLRYSILAKAGKAVPRYKS